MGLVKSRYNFTVTLSNNRLGIYNSKTGAIVCSEPGQGAKLQAALDNPEGYADSNLLPSLISQGFLVENDRDEIADIRSWYTAFVTDRRLVHLTMLPAEACNFACPYCFQYNKRHLLMKPWVYEATLRLIERIALENHNRGEQTYVKVSWFGGEPTLAPRQIIEFQNRLREMQDQLDIEVRGTLVTNGYLLTPQLLRLFLDANIREFQVTLDGDKKTHDQLRKLKSGKPTFETIYRNLRGIAELPESIQFKMAIRINFLRSTVSSVADLIEKLGEDFGHDSRFVIYCRPVYEFPTTRTDIQDVAADICTLEEGLGLQNAFAFMVREKLRLSSLTRMFDPLPIPTPAWCPAERQYSYIIGADGLLFPCETLVGDANFAIGRLAETGIALYNNPMLEQWKKDIFEADDNPCLLCKLLPVCMGGCLRERVFSRRLPCFWREEDILWALREYIESSRALLGPPHQGEIPGPLTMR